MLPKHQSYQSRQEMHGSSFEIFNYIEPRTEPVPVHHHDFYEIYFYLSGNEQFMVENKTYSLRSGDILLVSPGKLHRAVVEPDVSDERIVLWIDKDFLAGLREPGEELTRCFETGQEHLRPTPVERAAIQTVAMELVNEYYGKNYGSSLASLGLFIRLMVEINRITASGAAENQNDAADQTLMSRVLEYIGEHYTENISLDSLAARFYVSKYHLSHEFSAVVGTSVYKYVILKRLAAARQLIADGMRPGDACHECGYRDYANFYRAFISLYGEKPGSIKLGKEWS